MKKPIEKVYVGSLLVGISMGSAVGASSVQSDCISIWFAFVSFCTIIAAISMFVWAVDQHKENGND